MHLTNFDLDNYLKELETIVNMDSGSSYPEGVAKVADFFIKKYKELGCYTDKVNLSPRIGPALGLNKHTDGLTFYWWDMDTVFPKVQPLKDPFGSRTALPMARSGRHEGRPLSAYYVIKNGCRKKS